MSEDASIEDKIGAFDGLLEYIEDIDLARDFLIIGGLRPLLDGWICFLFYSLSDTSMHFFFD